MKYINKDFTPPSYWEDRHLVERLAIFEAPKFIIQNILIFFENMIFNFCRKYVE